MYINVYHMYVSSYCYLARFAGVIWKCKGSTFLTCSIHVIKATLCALCLLGWISGPISSLGCSSRGVQNSTKNWRSELWGGIKAIDVWFDSGTYWAFDTIPHFDPWQTASVARQTSCYSRTSWSVAIFLQLMKVKTEIVSSEKIDISVVMTMTRWRTISHWTGVMLYTEMCNVATHALQQFEDLSAFIKASVLYIWNSWNSSESLDVVLGDSLLCWVLTIDSQSVPF